MRKHAAIDGVVVLELGERIGAGVCGSLLAQLGGTVIVPEWSDTDVGKHRHRAQMIAGKKSIGLTDGDAGDRALLDRLVARSDVVITSSDLDPASRPGAWPNAATRVECDVTGLGDGSAKAGDPLSDAQIQALTGILDTTGMPDTGPTPIRLPIVEFMTGVYAAAACLAALRVRKYSGKGQAIDMALYDCAFAAMATFLPRLLDGSGAPVGRVGNRHAMASPWNVFQARDGWVLVCAASDDQWRRICKVIGQLELAGDPRYLRVADRVCRHTDVDGLVQEWVGRGTIERCIDVMGSAGIPCGPVAKVDGWPREANLDHRGVIRRVLAPGGTGTLFVPASPLRLSLTPGMSPERIPARDEDRAEITALLQAAPAPLPRATGCQTLPLEGLRVLEIGHYTTAPLAARHLANLGADVIKIEPPEGEAVRGWPPARKGTGYFFAFTNADKRSLVLDLEAPEGAADLKELIARSDILVENLKPGALAKRGFSTEELARINPRLIYCAISGFGRDAVYSGRPAYDTVIQAMSGLMDLTRAGDVPVKSGISSADLLGAEMALVAILAAVEARDRLAVGQAIDLSMQDVGAWVTMPLWNGDDSAPRPRVLRASDGFVMVEEDGPGSAAEAPGAIAIAVDASGLTRVQLASVLRQSGRRAAPILSAAEMLASDQTRLRGLVFHMRDADGEQWPLLASPLRLKETPPIVRRVMGPLGGDGPSIL